MGQRYLEASTKPSLTIHFTLHYNRQQVQTSKTQTVLSYLLYLTPGHNIDKQDDVIIQITLQRVRSTDNQVKKVN